MGQGPPTDVIAGRAEALLLSAGRQVTAAHSRRVADEARQLAGAHELDADSAAVAAWLHDISAVYAPNDQLGLALGWGIEVLPEEREYPAILHQRLSARLAEGLFGVTDPAILAAIACHTTLRAHAGPLDILLYVSDKLAWDRPDVAPYETAMRAALTASLGEAALVHLRWMHEQSGSLRVVHPWLREAYEWLSGGHW